MGRKLTHQEFIELLKERNPHFNDINILSEYKGMYQKLHCECKVCGYEWEGNAVNLSVGGGCINCRSVQLYKKFAKSHKEFIQQIDDSNLNVKILGNYVNARTPILYECKICKHQWNITPDNLLRGHGCDKCAKKRNGTKQRLSHDEFIERVSIIHSNITIKTNYNGRNRKVQCQCGKCNYIWNPIAGNLLRGQGCPYCSHRVCRTGYNDIATVCPHLIKYFVNVEDAYTHTLHSNKKVLLKCPDCGHEKYGTVCKLTTNGFRCVICSDKLSYPNKFLRQMLSQLPVENVKYEYSPKWVKPYKYDGYFEYQNTPYLIEMDGGLGHGKTKYKSTEKDVEGLQRDLIKNKLAEINNIKLIRIDCIKSDRKYISNNILNSQLAEIFDLSYIDWTKCDKNSQKNLVKEVCDYYEQTHSSVAAIAEKFKISTTTVRVYLRKGNKFHWCNYIT